MFTSTTYTLSTPLRLRGRTSAPRPRAVLRRRATASDLPRRGDASTFLAARMPAVRITICSGRAGPERNQRMRPSPTPPCVPLGAAAAPRMPTAPSHPRGGAWAVTAHAARASVLVCCTALHFRPVQGHFGAPRHFIRLLSAVKSSLTRGAEQAGSVTCTCTTRPSVPGLTYLPKPAALHRRPGGISGKRP